MKHKLFALLFLSLLAFPSLAQTPQRNPVLEYCTGTWCQWCPCGHQIIRENVMTTIPNAIVISYHGPANTASDPFSTFTGNQIISGLGMSSYPTGIVDRTSAPISRSAWLASMNNRLTVAPTVDINLQPQYNASTRQLTVSASVNPLVTLDGTYKVSVLILEDGLVYTQTGNASCTGGTGYVHNHVVRSFLNDYLGDVLSSTTWTPGQIVTKNFVYTVPQSFNEAQCKLVALVYKTGAALNTSEIQQAVEKPVVAAPMTVVAPNGGEQWYIGQPKNILWAAASAQNVKIEYSANNGTSWTVVAASVPAASGTFAWTVPNTPSTQCKVRVSDAANATIIDESNGTFTILAQPTAGWTTVNSGTTGDIWGIDFLDANNVWISASTGDVKKSTDGGATFTAAGNAGEGAYSIAVLSPTTAVVATGPSSGNGVIKRTTDGGTTWTQAYTATGAWFNFIDNSDANNVWALSDPIGGNFHIVKSTDGGATWALAPNLPAAPATNVFGANNSWYRVGNTYWFGTGGSSATLANRVYKSTNGPNGPWTFGTTSAQYPGSIAFSSATGNGLTGFWSAANSQNKTTDGGATWTAYAPAVGTTNGIEYIQGTATAYAGTSSGVHKTTDNGTTWAAETLPIGVSAIYFVRAHNADLMLGGGASGVLIRKAGGAPVNSVTVTAPNGGENWAIGTQKNITWNASGVTTVKIEYTTNNGTNWTLIGTAPARNVTLHNDAEASTVSSENITGTYAWTIPNTPSAQCKVRVSDNTNAAVTDMSDNVFTISQGTPGPTAQFSINVSQLGPALVSLYGNEFDGNRFFCSQWNATNGKIYLVNKAGTTLDSTAVTGMTAGFRDFAWDGQFLYGAPNSTTIYKIDPATWAVVGTITAPQSVRGIAYNKAADGFYISNWNTAIMLISRTGSVISQIPAATHGFTGMSGLAYDTLSSGGPFLWVFHGGAATDPKILHKVNPATGATISSIDITSALVTGAIGGGLWVSDKYATGTVTLGGLNQSVPHTIFGYQIAGGTPTASVTVSAPNGGENWQVGQQKNITWQSSLVTNVKIEYSTNNGTAWAVVIASTPAASGMYAWTVPNTPSTQCLVKISDAANATVMDVSNAVFTISAAPPAGWTAIATGMTGDIWGIDYADANNVWITSSTGAAKRSTDGGASWIAAGNPGEGAYSVAALSATTAVVALGPSAGDGKLMRTTDGGTTWSQVYTAAGAWFNFVDNNGQDNLWALSDPIGGNFHIVKSTNGGATWALAGNLPAAPATNVFGANNSWFQLGNTYWFGTGGSSATLANRVYKSTNGPDGPWTFGTTSAQYVGSIAFASAANGYVGFWQATNTLNKTTDGGATWAAVTTPTGLTHGLEYSSANNAYYAATMIGLYKSADGGTTWTAESTPIGTDSLNFVRFFGQGALCGGSNGFLLKFGGAAPQPSVTVTAPNGGENWTVGSQKNITWASNSVATVKIEYTTNNGTNWTLIGTAPGKKEGIANEAEATSISSEEITGSYTWTVPNTPSTQCKVRVSDNTNASVTDMSDNTFTISTGTPGPTQQFTVNVSTLGPALVSLYGSEFDGNRFFCSQWNATNGRIYIVNKAGTTLDSTAVTGMTAGFRDFAWDGQFLYGAPNSTTIYKIDPATWAVVGTITSPQAVRGIAYNKAADGFYVSNWNSNILLISRTGSVISQIAASTHGFTGMSALAYDTLTTGGPHLWVFHGGAATDPKVLYKVSPTNAQRRDSIVITDALPTGAIGGGLWISDKYAAGTTTLGGLNQGTPHLIFGYQVGSAAPPTITWQNVMNVKDAGTSNQNVTFGTSPQATNGIDPALGEAPLPPVPPTGIFDARFELPTTPAEYSLKDFRSDTNKAINWIVKFQASSSGYPVTLSWNSAALPAGNFTLKDLLTGQIVNVNMKTQNSYALTNTGIQALKIEYNRTLCKDIAVASGWNILSIPLQAASMATGVIFPAATSPAYGYAGNYVMSPELSVGKGYFLRYPNATVINVCGTATTARTIPLLAGWNIVGGYDTDLQVSALTTTPAGLLTSPFYGYSAGYQTAAALMVGKGYWVRSSGAGVLNLPTAVAKEGDAIAELTFKKEWGKLIITDADGKQTTLFVAQKLDNAALYELPPVPPAGIFDVRFASQRAVEVLPAEGQEVTINGAVYPIEIRSEGIELRVSDKATAGKYVNGTLRNGNVIRIDNSGINSIQVSTAEKPVTYALFQNYPNPFNPATTIKFGIPERANVQLKVYNQLGQQVALLLNGEREAGYYELEFNAGNLPSGIYFYELSAGQFSQIKKLMLMK